MLPFFFWFTIFVRHAVEERVVSTFSSFSNKSDRMIHYLYLVKVHIIESTGNIQYFQGRKKYVYAKSAKNAYIVWGQQSL